MNSNIKELNEDQITILLENDIPFKYWGVIWRPTGEYAERGFYKVKIDKEYADTAEKVLAGSW
jgi:hypothetical protein